MGRDAGTSRSTGPRGDRPRALTGDRPTGPLHLGHLVGTLRSRVSLQETHRTFVLVADLHMLTTRLDGLGQIETDIREDVLGNLAVGLDPAKATIYLQSQVPETAELFLYLGMLVSVSRAQRIPTLKDKIRELRITRPSYGLLGYPILQAADILLMRADVVPVGPDQASHVELAREIARSFNGRFGPVFPVPTALAPRGGTLPGTDGSPKMSRSVGNTINLFDDETTVRAKVMAMYTDPGRLRATDPGHVEGNPVFAYHDAFNPDPAEVADLKARYVAGRVGDVEVKLRLVAALDSVLSPIRQRRRDLLAEKPSIVEDVLRSGAKRARREAARTMREVRAAMHLGSFE
ncbi:MAG TPA: tryptophan--tRNA ligase [Candidatus Limnocylindrales bacterium]|nr:tryptophan--tRNA ligase [Candidatus Limnocylindrales bacterium]